MNFQPRVLDYSTSTGTGAMFLSNTPDPGYSDFSALPESNAYPVVKVPYAIVAVDGSGVPTGQWETGVGIYDDLAGTLTRSTPEDGSSGRNTPVNFSSGTKKVFVTPSRSFFQQAGLGFQYAMARGFALP